MGKGGFFLDFAEMGINAIRGIFACLCCLLCFGPILLIVGIVMLVAKNNRAANITEYNQAVKAFEPVIPVMENTRGYMDTYTSSYIVANYSLMKQAVPIKGNKDGVDAATSYLQQTNYQLSRSTSTRTAKLIYTPIRGGIPTPITSYDITVPQPPSSNQESKSLYCDESKCSTSEMRSKCQKESGCSTGYSYSSRTSNCRRNQLCGTCRWYFTTPVICLQVRMNNITNRWESNSGLTCDYGKSTSPFTEQKKECTSSATTSSSYYQFRSEKDPYIVLSRLTKGDMDFGLTAAQQRNIGLALMAIGILLTVCVIGGMVMAKNAFTKKEQRGRVQQAMPWGGGFQQQGQAPYQAYQQPMQQQPGYAQPPPQPGYAPQPQPGYAQPQPGYAQPAPQPGYGAPPPAQQPYPQQGYPAQQPPPAGV